MVTRFWRSCVALSFCLALFGGKAARADSFCGARLRILGYSMFGGGVTGSIESMVSEHFHHQYEDPRNKNWTEIAGKLSGRDRLAMRDQLENFLSTSGNVDETAALEAFRRAARFPREPRLRYYYDILTHAQALGHPADGVVDAAAPRANEAYDPFQRAFTLADSPVGRLRALLELQQLVSKGIKGAEDLAKVSAWASSPERAVYLYQRLGDFGAEAGPLLDYLAAHNPEFRNATRVNGVRTAVLTYSFDKETLQLAAAVRMYRPPEIPEDQWFHMTDQQRYDAIVSRSPGRYLPAPATVLTPTREKPASVGGLQEEVPGQVLEVAHASFEIDPHRLFEQMKDVAHRLEAGGFHVHIVMEVPKDYPDAKVRQFSEWVKQINNFFYLRNIEQGEPGPVPVGSGSLLTMPNGLSSSSTIKIPESPARRGFFARLFDLPSTHLPASLADITKESHKRFNAAVRMGIYGQAVDPRFVRLGVEMRDVENDFAHWPIDISTVGAGMRDRIWEGKSASETDHGQEVSLTPQSRDSAANVLKDRHVGDAEWMAEAEPMVALPFQDFEHGLFYDYHTHAYRRPTAAEAQRISEAREAYLRELHAIYRANQGGGMLAGLNLPGMRAQIRVALHHWGQKARVSELYSGI